MRISDWSSDVCSSDLVSNRRQRLVEIGDQVVGILDADRHADQIVGAAERLLALVGDRQMRHRGGVAGERLGAAEADRELRDLQRVEKAEALRLASLDEQRKGRSGAGAVALEDILLRPFLQKAEIAEPLDLRMLLQEGADLGGILARAAHAQLDRLQAAQQHPGGIGVAAGADGVAHHADRTEPMLRSEEHTSDLQSLMRFSSAVFCLKKKHNSTKYQIQVQAFVGLQLYT